MGYKICKQHIFILAIKFPDNVSTMQQQWYLLLSTFTAVIPTIMSEHLMFHVLQCNQVTIYDSTNLSLTVDFRVECLDEVWDDRRYHEQLSPVLN